MCVSVFGGGRGARRRPYTSHSTSTTRIILHSDGQQCKPFWCSMNCRGQSHQAVKKKKKTQLLKRWTKADFNRHSSAYQSSVQPLSQTSSCTHTSADLIFKVLELIKLFCNITRHNERYTSRSKRVKWYSPCTLGIMIPMQSADLFPQSSLMPWWPENSAPMQSTDQQSYSPLVFQNV